MIETKSLSHTVRLFATSLCWTDLFKPVMYCSYHGDLKKIPFWYKKEKGHSCVTDLKLSLDELLGKMKSNTRNEIRRAEREGCAFAVEDGVQNFIPFYNSFCDSKGFADQVSEARLGKFKHLLVTKSMKGETVLAMHVTQLDPIGKTALLILSGSQRLDADADQKLIGWGNRFLHYKDLEWLKAQGYEIYDWCGVCLDPNDPRYSIGQFKLGLGGTVVESWTLRTPLYVFLERAHDLVRKLRSK